jgi:hypothetical protein
MTPEEDADDLDATFGVGRYYKTMDRDIWFVKKRGECPSGRVTKDTLEHDEQVLAILKDRYEELYGAG